MSTFGASELFIYRQIKLSGVKARISFFWGGIPHLTAGASQLTVIIRIFSLNCCLSFNTPLLHALTLSPCCPPRCRGGLLDTGLSVCRLFTHIQACSVLGACRQTIAWGLTCESCPVHIESAPRWLPASFDWRILGKTDSGPWSADLNWSQQPAGVLQHDSALKAAVVQLHLSMSEQ